MSNTYKLNEEIKLKVVARNYKDKEKINVKLTFLDENKKELGIKKDVSHVKDYKAIYPFVIENIAKEKGINSEDIAYVKGWMDADGDGKIDYGEEVILEIEEIEEKITIIVELPHSKETGWGAKGLAGHTAMAIGERFFDYGPDYSETKTFDEQQYQADLNQDGDMNDKVKINEIPNVGFYFAPGRPWWGENISLRNNKKATDITLNEAIHFITKLPWQSSEGITNDGTYYSIEGTYVYGTVYKIEFYVKKSQSDKMLEWWKDRYQHLKVYSVKPWTGEQCTTTVKQALAYGGIDDIDWNTLTPDAILEDLKTEIKSTSRQHKDQKAEITLIKKEAKDWKP